jgi:hypothetical protein
MLPCAGLGQGKTMTLHNPSRRRVLLGAAGLASATVLSKSYAAHSRGEANISAPLADTDAHGILVWDVSGLDYVAEEFFLSGRADILKPVSMADAADVATRDNSADLGKREFKREVIAAAQPFTTRLIVYRPRAMNRCSGRVILETMHPNNGGSSLTWAALHGFFAARGDICVGLQHPLTVAGLKAADPARYAALNAPDPTQLWGMLSESGRILRDAGNGPLRGFKVRHLIMTGYSYTGVATATYANYHHQDAKLANRRPIFDAYIPMANAQYVRPLDVPVIKLNTQSDFNSFGGLNDRRSDDSRYRHYEVAGAAHVALPPPIDAARAPAKVIAAPAGQPHFSPADCQASFPPGSHPNDFPLDLVQSAVFQNMYDWLERGIAPPPSSLIEADATGSAKLDGHGNALGGIRYPQVSVPVASYGVGSTAACSLFGYTLPFDSEKCRALYGDQGTYVSRVRAATVQLVANKLLLGDGAARIIGKAAGGPRF